MPKLSPAKAFELTAALYPDTKRINLMGSETYRYPSMEPTTGYRMHNPDIEWGKETQYPAPPKRYRPVTVHDLMHDPLPMADFSDNPDFPSDRVVRGTLIGCQKFSSVMQWKGRYTAYYKYCRVEDASPEDTWRPIQENDKNVYGGNSDQPNCELKTPKGIVAPCFWSGYQECWIQYRTNTIVENPTHIRPTKGD